MGARSRWSPRACGGSPGRAYCDLDLLAVAPRLRGFAPDCGRDLEISEGSPRACGGSPWPSWSRDCPKRVAPRLRGFALLEALTAPAHVGRPAPAGVRPRIGGENRGLPWSPRACGGSPYLGKSKLARVRVAPRLRGFAPEEGRMVDAGRGRPAPAGVRPTCARIRRRPSRSPALAGVCPTGRCGRAARVRSPRELRGFARLDLPRPHRHLCHPARAGVRPRDC